MKCEQPQWKILQYFGDKSSFQNVCQEDIISAISFSKDGQFLSIGDRAGRLIVFALNQSKKKEQPKYQYYTELQSHVQDFDPLKSQAIPQQINCIDWLGSQGNWHYIISSNDKIIKLWKLSEKCIKKMSKPSGKDLSIPILQKVEETICPTLLRSFPNLHPNKIKSISSSRNEQFLLSADQQKIFLWSMQASNQAYVMIDITKGMQDMKQQITSCKYHPTLDNVFLYSTNLGDVRLVDTRARITRPNILHFTYPQGPKNFFSQLIANSLDAKFNSTGSQIVSRDVLSVHIWDVRMNQRPSNQFEVNNVMKNKLCQLYDNQCIWDQFNLSVSQDNKHILTGSYNNTFNVIGKDGSSNMQMDICFSKKASGRDILEGYALQGKIDYQFKTLKNCFHPSMNMAAVTCLNSLFFYYK